MRHRLRRITSFLMLGLFCAVASAFFCETFVDVDKGTTASFQDREWLLEITETRGAMKLQARREAASWSPQQATRAPNTLVYGDHTTAWAAKTRDGSPQWLMLEYEHPLVLATIDIYESYYPGAVTRVTLVDDNGTETEVWSGEDPNRTNDLQILRIQIPRKPDGKSVAATRRVKLYIGRPDIPGWNEIDAVGVWDESGKPHWAVGATASSWFGDPGTDLIAGSENEWFMPSWSQLLPATAHSARGGLSEYHMIDARGWPMVALFSRTNQVNSASAVSTAATTLSLFSPPISRSTRVAIPWHPIWGGLIVDALAFAMILAAVWLTLTRPRRFVVEVSRLKRGCCTACGYDLNYDFVAGCPECGWRRNQRRE